MNKFIVSRSTVQGTHLYASPTREQWFNAIARAANAQPWCANVVAGSAAAKFGWNNGPSLRSAANAIGLDATGSVAAVSVNAWADTVEAPSAVPEDPGEAVIAFPR